LLVVNARDFVELERRRFEEANKLIFDARLKLDIYPRLFHSQSKPDYGLRFNVLGSFPLSLLEFTKEIYVLSY